MSESDNITAAPSGSTAARATDPTDPSDPTDDPTDDPTGPTGPGKVLNITFGIRV